MRKVTDRLGKGFFWGPPSHKRVAWLGAAAGLIVLALPLVIAVFGTGVLAGLGVYWPGRDGMGS
jgi:hypothetical protein